MGEWTYEKRVKAGKKAWRTRRRKKAWKGTCPYCHRKVWVSGQKSAGKWWHVNCLRMHAMKVPPPGKA